MGAANTRAGYASLRAVPKTNLNASTPIAVASPIWNISMVLSCSLLHYLLHAVASCSIAKQAFRSDLRLFGSGRIFAHISEGVA